MDRGEGGPWAWRLQLRIRLRCDTFACIAAVICASVPPRRLCLPLCSLLACVPRGSVAARDARFGAELGATTDAGSKTRRLATRMHGVATLPLRAILSAGVSSALLAADVCSDGGGRHRVRPQI